MINILLWFLMLVSNPYHEANNLTIKVNDYYSGWCYIVPVQNNVVPAKQNIYLLNKDGVCYIDRELFLSNSKLIVIMTSKDISSSIKFLSTVEMTAQDEEGQTKKYNLLKFYIPTMKEKKKGNKFWNDVNNQIIYNRSEKLTREKLIKTHKILFD